MADPVSRIFGGGPAVPTLPSLPTSVPLPPAVGPDAALIRLAGEAIALNREITRLYGESERLLCIEQDAFEHRHIHPKIAQCDILHRALSRMCPTTKEGLTALVAAVIDYSDSGLDIMSPAIWALLVSLPELLSAVWISR